MTATVHQLFPDLSDEAERLADEARLRDQAVWWQQQVKNARAGLRSPHLYSDDELRDFCATLQSRWGDATDYCQADAMIFALNKRERQRAREAERLALETPTRSAMRHARRWPTILAGAGLWAAVMLGLAGWL